MAETNANDSSDGDAYYDEDMGNEELDLSFLDEDDSDTDGEKSAS